MSDCAKASVRESIAAAREYARQALGDAKAEREPTPEPVRVVSENVERLREAKNADEGANA